MFYDHLSFTTKLLETKGGRKTGSDVVIGRGIITVVIPIEEVKVKVLVRKNQK